MRGQRLIAIGLALLVLGTAVAFQVLRGTSASDDPRARTILRSRDRASLPPPRGARTLRGTVVTAMGTPAAVVEIKGPDPKRVLTDAQGRFTFESLFAPDDEVTARNAGHYAHETLSFQSWTESPLDIVLGPVFHARGVLVDTGGRPVPNASVQLSTHPLHENEEEASRLGPPSATADAEPPDDAMHVSQVRTDEKGLFAFERLQSGRYMLRVDADRHPPCTPS